MIRSINIPCTDQFVWNEVVIDLFKSRYLQDEIKRKLGDGAKSQSNNDIAKAKNVISRLGKEKTRLIDNIAAIETAKLLGQQDERIADKIVQNLKAVLAETEARIEQATIEFQRDQADKNWRSAVLKEIDMDPVFDGTNYAKILKPDDRKKALEQIIDKIHVHYDKAESLHELRFDFRIPILRDYNDRRNIHYVVSQKKTQDKQGAARPLSGLSCDGGVVPNGSLVYRVSLL